MKNGNTKKGKLNMLLMVKKHMILGCRLVSSLWDSELLNFGHPLKDIDINKIFIKNI